MLSQYNDLEVQLELLSGCAYRCAACYVDKHNGFKTSDHMYTVVQELITRYRPYALGIGSTDIFTADNTKAVLSDLRLLNLIGRFERVVVNSTLAKLDEGVLQQLKALGKPIQINIVFPETKLYAERYLTRIRENLERVYGCLDEVIIHPQANASKTLKVEDYDALDALYNRVFDKGVDFNLSFSRTSLAREEYVDYFERLKTILDNTAVAVTGSTKYTHLDCVNPTDAAGPTVFYYNNQFYLVPFVYDALLQATASFRFDSLADYDRLYNTLTERQYTYAMSPKRECGQCEFLPVCVDRQVLAVMEDYAIDHCVLPKKTIRKANGWA